MTLYIHIWLCHQLEHIIDIRHLGEGGGGPIWQLLATMTIQAYCLSNTSVTAQSCTCNIPQSFHFYSQSPE